MNDPVWRYMQGIVTESRYHRVYRDDKLGVQLEVITKRRNGMPIGKGKNYFFLDGKKGEFRSETALMKAVRAAKEIK